MKKIIIPFFLLIIVFLSGCIQQETRKEIVCNKPYIRVGTECCLDQNDNNICDTDEQQTTTTISSIENGITCSPCFAYFLYMDYKSGILTIRNGNYDIEAISTNVGMLSKTTANPNDYITITGLSKTGNIDIVITYITVESGLSHTDSATINNQVFSILSASCSQSGETIIIVISNDEKNKNLNTIDNVVTIPDLLWEVEEEKVTFSCNPSTIKPYESAICSYTADTPYSEPIEVKITSSSASLSQTIYC